MTKGAMGEVSLTSLAASLRAAVADELPAARALRRALHAEPRISGDETDTTRRVADALCADLVPVRSVEAAGTGRIVVLGEGTDAVGLRGELDALPVVERTGVAWSATGTAMHACGHDLHLAALVAACRAVARVDAPLPVAAVLQPREESAPSGARDIVDAGVLPALGIRAMIGAHVQPQVAGGTVAVTPGLVNASVDEFEITVEGHGGHAGYPHTVRDPVSALAAILLNLQQISARRIDPVHGAVCTVGHIRAGTTHNVVPDRAFAHGSLRAMRPEDRTQAIADVREIATASATAYGCRADVVVHDGEPALHNDPTLAAITAAVLRADGHEVGDEFRSFGADDFAHYCEAMPSLMLFVGVESEVGLHDSRFLPGDEVVDLVAAALLAGYVAAVEARRRDPSS